MAITPAGLERRQLAVVNVGAPWISPGTCRRLHTYMMLTASIVLKKSKELKNWRVSPCAARSQLRSCFGVGLAVEGCPHQLVAQYRAWFLCVCQPPQTA